MKPLASLALLALLPLPAGGQDTKPSFSASTDLVVLHVTVKDRNGAHVAGLPQEAFAVSEGGRPQAIRFYTSDDAPVTVGLMIDNSGSMAPHRERLIAAGATFAESSNPLDEMFAVTFDDEVRAALPAATPFTQDVPTLRDGLTSALNAGGLYRAVRWPRGRTRLRRAGQARTESARAGQRRQRHREPEPL